MRPRTHAVSASLCPRSSFAAIRTANSASSTRPSKSTIRTPSSSWAICEPARGSRQASGACACAHPDLVDSRQPRHRHGGVLLRPPLARRDCWAHSARPRGQRGRHPHCGLGRRVPRPDLDAGSGAQLSLCAVLHQSAAARARTSGAADCRGVTARRSSRASTTGLPSKRPMRSSRTRQPAAITKALPRSIDWQGASAYAGSFTGISTRITTTASTRA